MDVVLLDDQIGRLELGCDPYVVTELQVGWPAVRSVMRAQALSDGAIDDTRFLGARAVTLAMRLKNSLIPMQRLYDRVLPYMSPRVRPQLIWRLPGGEQWRSMIVRGENAPMVVNGPKFPALVCSWVCADGRIAASDENGGGEVCQMISPSTDVEAGRTYNEDYADGGRGPYPPSAGIGGRLIDNPGNAMSDWRLTIFGAATNPRWIVNHAEMRFDENGGFDLLGGSSIVIDTQQRTALLNGMAGFSVYDKMNFTEWTWDQVRLRPGTNSVRFDAEAMTPSATAEICYRPYFLG
jgi:hypothetical protein